MKQATKQGTIESSDSMRSEERMKYDFDQVIERRGTDSHKWKKYGEAVIPMWVADMDFVSAQPILRALERMAAALKRTPTTSIKILPRPPFFKGGI